MKVSSDNSQVSSANKCETCLRLCHFLTVMGKILFFAIILLLILILGIDAYLRWKGEKPVPLAARGLSATIPDEWTDWANRPNVSESEYTKTNAFGLHDDREYSLVKPKDIVRVAVVGSSVVWGPGQFLKDTIPKAVEARLREKGCKAEVMNFGYEGFNLTNTSALMQVKVHQFHPDIVVTVVDVQEIFPKWPRLDPDFKKDSSVQQLSWYGALFKRASEYNVLLSLLDNPVAIQQMLEKKIGLPLSEPLRVFKTESQDESVDATSSFEKISVEEYEKRRSKELGAIIAAISGFYKEMNIPLYFVSPYGPYFKFSQKELSGFSFPKKLSDEAVHVYGSLDKALPRQIAFATDLLIAKASKNDAHVINMLEASRQSEGLKNPDFSSDGIHFTAAGNHHVGEIIADRLIADGMCKG